MQLDYEADLSLLFGSFFSSFRDGCPVLSQKETLRVHRMLRLAREISPFLALSLLFLDSKPSLKRDELGMLVLLSPAFYGTFGALFVEGPASIGNWGTSL